MTLSLWMFLLGILTAAINGRQIFFVLCFVFGICLVFYKASSRRKAGRFCLFFSLLFLSGIFLFFNRSEKVSELQSLFPASESVVFQGKLSKKEFKNETYVYTFSDVRMIEDSSDVGTFGVSVFSSEAGISFDAENKAVSVGKILLYTEEDCLYLGSVVYGEATVLSMNRAQNEGGFDEQQYLYGQGIFIKGRVEKFTVKSVPRILWREALYELRLSMDAFYNEVLPGEEGSILSAMTIGEKNGMDQEVKDLFSSSGFSHILAISGLHISVVGMNLYSFLRRRRVSYALSGLLAGALVLIYGYFTGGSVSAQRAVGMFLLMVLAQALGKAYDMESALSVFGLYFLLQNPLVIYNAGFVFSFGAVLGVAKVAIPWQMAYEQFLRYKHREQKGWKINVLQKKGGEVLSALGIVLWTMPMTAHYFYAVPLYAVLLNIFLLPFLGVILGLGLLGGLSGLSILLLPVHFLIYFYEWVLDASLSLPGAVQIVGNPRFYTVILYYALLLLWTHGMQGAVKRSTKKLHGEQDHNVVITTFRFVPLLAALCVLMWLPKKSENQVVMLSVGQGDGIYIESEEGLSVMVDGGSTSNDQVGRYTILPFLKSRGIRKIDIWFVTHTDEDHISGLCEALEYGYPIRKVIFASSIEQNENYEMLLALIKKQQVEACYVRQWDELGDDSMRFTMLFPSADYPVEGANENSLIFYLECEDFSGVFTGDTAIEQERFLLENEEVAEFLKERGGVDIYKVAHHGSNGSNDSQWMELLNPSVAICSAGKNNLYHHPGEEAVERILDLGIPMYCTIDCGQITVQKEEDSLMLFTYLEEGGLWEG